MEYPDLIAWSGEIRTRRGRGGRPERMSSLKLGCPALVNLLIYGQLVDMGYHRNSLPT